MTVPLLAALLGCGLVPEPLPSRNCATRTTWWPDADGDGLGERTEVYVGCDPPAGWVTLVGPPGGSGSPVPTGATGATGDTGGSGATTSTGDTAAPGSTGDTAAPGSTGETGGTGVTAGTGDTGP